MEAFMNYLNSDIRSYTDEHKIKTLDNATRSYSFFANKTFTRQSSGRNEFLSITSPSKS